MANDLKPRNYGDYLHAVAFRTLHEESVLQPRRASLFESEFAGTEATGSAAPPVVREIGWPRPVLPAANGPEPFRRHGESHSRDISLAHTTRPPAEPTGDSMPQAPLLAASHMEAGTPHKADEKADQPHPIASSRSLQTMFNGAEEPTPVRHTEAIRAPQPRMAERGITHLRGVMNPLVRDEEAPAPALLAAREAMERLTPSAEPPRITWTAPEQQPDAPRLPETPTPASPMSPLVRPAEAVLVPRAVPGMRGLIPLFSPQLAAPSEPAVEITIGKLEIRAGGQAPAKPLRMTTPPPQPTLREYLRRRAAGEQS